MTKAQSLEPIPLRPDRSAIQERNVRSLVRACIATARGRISQPRTEPSKIAERAWPSDDTARLITRASSDPPASVSTTSPLARQVWPDFVKDMVPYSAAAALIDAGLKFTLGDGVAYINVPSFAAVPTGASFVAEASPLPVMQYQEFAPSALTLKKIGAICVLSEELVDSSNAEPLVRDVMMRTVGLALDTVLFDPNPATSVRPAGLLYNIAATPEAGLTGGSNFEQMCADLSKLAGLVAHVGGRIIYIVSPARGVNINLHTGYPLADVRMIEVVPSTAVADDTIIAVAADAFVSATTGAPEIRAVKDATVHMETQPTAITTPGTPPTVASPTRSLYQTRSIGLQLRAPVDWALRGSNVVAWMQGVNW
jgi:hypothetical protein